MGHPITHDAETVNYADYAILGTRPDRFIENRVVEVTTGFCCPRCGHDNKPLENGVGTECPECQLHFRLYANRLSYWD